ncbi:MAG: hypothetical protein WBK32_10220 [Candidatus Saccharicenans sp.]
MGPGSRSQITTSLTSSSGQQAAVLLDPAALVTTRIKVTIPSEAAIVIRIK